MSTISRSGATSALSTRRDELAAWRRAREGDRDAFSAAVESFRRELQVHCYRMVGSLDEAEDLVQETLLRAWRRRETFEGRSTLRAWLYAIATNVCIDALAHRTRRLLPPDLVAASDPAAPPPPASEIPWLEPVPDAWLDQIVDQADGPDATAFARETIELAFLAAIQFLPPRQRAVLILRDVLGWNARDTASAIGMSLIAAKSALQRARETLKLHLPDQRLDWTRSREPDASEQKLLERYMDAWHRADVNGLADLLADDARLAMPPTTAWYEGRDAVATFLASTPLALGAATHLHVPTRANRQPAFAVFLVAESDRPAQAPPATGEAAGVAPPSSRGLAPRPVGVEVLRLRGGKIVEIDVFRDPRMLERFAITQPSS